MSLKEDSDSGAEKGDDGRRARHLRTVNVTCAKSHLPVLKRALPLAQLRPVESPCAGDKSVKGDIIWVVTADDVAQRLRALRPRQWLSHIPGLHVVCSKQGLAQALASAGEDFDWVPQTWSLPKELEAVLSFCGKHPSRALIYKPSEAGMGEAVFLVMGRADAERKIGMMRGAGAIAQTYIQRPLLIEGRKCDLRLYLAIVIPAPAEPWHTLLFHEGLVRICSEPYAAPSRGNLHHAGAHLTNTAISSLRSGSAASTGTCVETLAQLSERLGPDRWADVWQAIRGMLGRVLTLCEQHVTPAPCPCFQILGADVLLDENLQAHMLELNDLVSLKLGRVVGMDDPVVQELGLKRCTAPCFNHRQHAHAPSSLDEQVKIPLVENVLNVVQRIASHGTGVPQDALLDGLPFDAL